ncbi:hypothetical protein EVAR_6008_1 [Eumeta japonica]|uniref:Uncharacterized protein n=1 Tax=Eumeta variegata TaxID=151549 RepID=A0A4C1TCZ8_EUMVA|nr:hypothetical protein EVAR_6008_1 [Eumeta japonica]
MPRAEHGHKESPSLETRPYKLSNDALCPSQLRANSYLPRKGERTDPLDKRPMSAFEVFINSSLEINCVRGLSDTQISGRVTSEKLDEGHVKSTLQV